MSGAVTAPVRGSSTATEVPQSPEVPPGLDTPAKRQVVVPGSHREAHSELRPSGEVLGGWTPQRRTASPPGQESAFPPLLPGPFCPFLATVSPAHGGGAPAYPGRARAGPRGAGPRVGSVMASAPKRFKAAVESGAQGKSSADPLSGFLAWCGRAGVELNPKVRLSREGAVAGYGMLAAEELEAGEVLFTIPRTALLSQHTTSIHALLQEAQESLQSQSGWVPLLLALLHEYTASSSHWQPYFSLWQDFRSLDHPMFWPQEERTRLLQGTGIPEAVDKDLANIQLEYNSIILPFMETHPDIFDPKLHTLELYKELVAFVMAYSFQEPLEEEEEDEKGPNPPMMVPVADILNHVANHNANLEYSPQCLRMVTTQPVKKGQEIFNTYGQMANWQLLHMYGFAEPYPGNSHDTADIQMVTLRRAALQRAKSEAQRQLVSEQWDFLCQLEMVGEEGAFVLGWDEVLTEEELSMTLKVLCMSEEEFKEYKEQDGWEDDSDEEENSTLSNEALSRLKTPCKKLLYDSVLLTLESYGADLKAEQDLLNNKEAYKKLSRREQQALHVRYGQKRILHQLLELVQ
ncbi:N-lysine methyltransferase SETD6 [Motacilla alba alba]|uniref:N-lysine methyltransferase SETD6 n=1 Tax=Motacilla alba alba TaxID=1094192 RepID=UPI0018D4EABB|nr:N-lysine methyltransferase SETD6 [Motacilla alba alba]